MNRITLTRLICKLFPPLISQWIRNKLYPLNLARNQNIDFSIKSITGSTLQGNSLDYHGYRFFIHGFFDWRNIIVADSIFKVHRGDIIEIGANVGTETVSFTDVVGKSGNVHAFEPLPDNISILNKLSENHENLIIYQCAISNVNGEASFLIPPTSSSGTGKIIQKEIENKKVLKVKTSRLDDFLPKLNNVCLISIDTEGHEPMVLEGSVEILKKDRPFVIIEVSPSLLARYANSNPENIYRFFKKLDYEIYVIKKITIRKVSTNDLITKKPSNWLCISKDKKSIVRLIKKDLLIRAVVPWYILKQMPTCQKQN